MFEPGYASGVDDLRDRLITALEGPEPARFLVSLGEALTISARGGYEVQANSVAWLSGHNEIQHRIFPQVASILRGKPTWSADDFAGVVLGSTGYHTEESRQAVRWAVENTLRYWDPVPEGVE